MLIIRRAYASNQRPGYAGGFIVSFPSIPGIPNLIGQIRIN